MILDTEDWAARHHYYWHSNPKSKDLAKVLFDKAHLRPTVKGLWTLYHNSTGEARQKVFKKLLLLDPKLNGSSSAAMRGGIVTQTAADDILLKDADPAEATQKALDEYRRYKPREWDDGLDGVQHQKYTEELPAVLEHAVMGLREAMARENRYLGEIELLDKLPGLALPYNTRPDYVRKVDLKTKWSKHAPQTKAGWSKAPIPKSLSGMFDMKNVFQAAGFWALNGHQPVTLVYASANDYQVFTEDNAPELKPSFLADIVEEMVVQLRCTENLLRAADTKEQLLNLVAPDFNDLTWREPPGVIAEARKLWGLD